MCSLRCNVLSCNVCQTLKPIKQSSVIVFIAKQMYLSKYDVFNANTLNASAFTLNNNVRSSFHLCANSGWNIRNSNFCSHLRFLVNLL